MALAARQPDYRRSLYWALPLALVINATELYWFAYAVQHTAAPTPAPLRVELVERPPVPKIKPVVPPKPQPPAHKTRAVARPEVVAPQPQPVMTAPTPTPAAPTIAAPLAAPPVAAAPVAMPRASAPPSHSGQIGSSGARALVNPYPVIPDELRETALHEKATAHFHIAADGSVTVELVQPTQNLRLNRLLLDTLKHWKFFPAIKEGRPVASEQDVVINMQVQ
jgi:protein TonB